MKNWLKLAQRLRVRIKTTSISNRSQLSWLLACEGTDAIVEKSRQEAALSTPWASKGSTHRRPVSLILVKKRFRRRSQCVVIKWAAPCRAHQASRLKTFTRLQKRMYYHLHALITTPLAPRAMYRKTSAAWAPRHLKLWLLPVPSSLRSHKKSPKWFSSTSFKASIQVWSSRWRKTSPAIELRSTKSRWSRSSGKAPLWGSHIRTISKAYSIVITNRRKNNRELSKRRSLGTQVNQPLISPTAMRLMWFLRQQPSYPRSQLSLHRFFQMCKNNSKSSLSTRKCHNRHALLAKILWKLIL